MAKRAKKKEKSPKTARFGDLKIGKTFYLGPHALKKTRGNSAGQAKFGPDAIVLLGPRNYE